MAGDIVERGEYDDIFEFSYSNVVKITVGLYIPCELAVGRKLICESSGLIKEALRDVTCREVKLEKAEPMGFKVYLNWLYTDILGTKDARMQEEVKLLAELYFLGLKIKDVRFQNDIITAMVDKSQEDFDEDLPGIESIKVAYEGYCDTAAREAKPLQKVLVEMYTRNRYACKFNSIRKSAPAAFGMDLCTSVK